MTLSSAKVSTSNSKVRAHAFDPQYISIHISSSRDPCILFILSSMSMITDLLNCHQDVTVAATLAIPTPAAILCKSVWSLKIWTSPRVQDKSRNLVSFRRKSKPALRCCRCCSYLVSRKSLFWQGRFLICPELECASFQLKKSPCQLFSGSFFPVCGVCLLCLLGSRFEHIRPSVYGPYLANRIAICISARKYHQASSWRSERPWTYDTLGFPSYCWPRNGVERLILLTLLQGRPTSSTTGNDSRTSFFYDWDKDIKQISSHDAIDLLLNTRWHQQGQVCVCRYSGESTSGERNLVASFKRHQSWASSGGLLQELSTISLTCLRAR